jgi:hypothetical protein
MTLIEFGIVPADEQGSLDDMLLSGEVEDRLRFLDPVNQMIYSAMQVVEVEKMDRRIAAAFEQFNANGQAVQ